MGKVRLWDTKNCIGMYIYIDATEKTLYTQQSCTTHAQAQTQESCIYYAQASRQYPQEVGPGEAVVKLSRHLVEVDRDVAAPACTHPVKVHRQSQFVTLVDVEWSTVPDLQATAREEEGVHWGLQHHLCLMGCLQPTYRVVVY